MKPYIVLLISFCLVLQFNGCANDPVDDGKEVLVGELDPNNEGDNIDPTTADLDSLLSTLFTSFTIGGGIDLFNDIKSNSGFTYNPNMDTTILVDSVVTGKNGVINCFGEGLLYSMTKDETTQTTQYDSTDIEIREVYYNYSKDSTLFIGGESICRKLNNDTSYESSVVDFWQSAETEVCSLNLRFNGKYRGTIAGSITYNYHENSDMLLDSSLTATIVISSASKQITIDESVLTDYLGE